MPTAKQPKPKPTVWAILDQERNVQLYVGREAPYLEPNGFVGANRGTRFLGQLSGTDAKSATGFELIKVGKPVEVAITIASKRSAKGVG
jgi:hypothetical protein